MIALSSLRVNSVAESTAAMSTKSFNGWRFMWVFVSEIRNRMGAVNLDRVELVFSKAVTWLLDGDQRETVGR